VGAPAKHLDLAHDYLEGDRTLRFELTKFQDQGCAS